MPQNAVIESPPIIMESTPKAKEKYVPLGIREALEEARFRMKYAAAEYEAIGAHEEAERAAAIRKDIMALSMERW